MYVFWSEFLSFCFSEGFYYCSAIIIEADCTCMGTSLDPPLSLSLFVTASGYIIGNWHVYEQARSAQSVCKCAVHLFVFLHVYVCLFIRIYFSLFVSEYVYQSPAITHCRCNCTFLDSYFSLCFPLNVSIRFRVYCHWFCVYTYVSWSEFLSLSHSFSLFVSVSGYIIGNLHVYEQPHSAHSACNCAIDFSLLFFVVYVRLLIRISFSVFVSECVQ